jgi:hypothetical protein
MLELNEIQEHYWKKLGFQDGVFAERTRLIAYLVEKGIVRRDAFGMWVRETMGDDVTDLPDLDGSTLPKRQDGKVFIHPTEIGAMMVRNNHSFNSALIEKLIELRKLTPAGSDSSLEITRWIVELEKIKENIND